jgi:hypothetical protein
VILDAKSKLCSQGWVINTDTAILTFIVWHGHAGEPLYDWSNRMLSCDDHQVLQHHQITLSHLKTIFKAFADQSSAVTEQGKRILF